MSTDRSNGVSRRTLAKGAAWAVPAAAVAAAAPAYAVSGGPLTFTGGACKLPGKSHPVFKGYVFELVANNVTGPNPLDTMTVITNVTVQGVSYDFTLVPVDAYSCTCGPCGSAPADKQFCTPDGVVGQRILVFTADAPDSQNTAFTVTYQRYECSGASCTAFDASPVTISSGALSTPPAQGNTCTIEDYDQHLPSGATTTTTTGEVTTTTTTGEVTTTTTTGEVTTTTTTAEVTTTTTTAEVTTTTTTAA